MRRHFAVRDFFRQVPNVLLARFFAESGLFSDLDWSSMRETRPEALFSAWLDLADDLRAGIEATLREVFDLGCEKGFHAILDEARWQLRESPDDLDARVEELARLPNHFHRAMVVYLDHRQWWKGATRFYHADMLQYWRKRRNLGHRRAAVDEASVKKLAERIRDYFHRTEGRGNNCVVETFRRGDLDYFFAYPEDYSQHSVEWVRGEFRQRPHNPAFEVVYVYSQNEGTLDINVRGTNKVVEPLQGMFATVILKLDQLPPDPRDERVYDLNPLRHKGFSFVYAPCSGIERIAVKKLRLSSRIKKGDRITLEADTVRDADAVYSLLDRVGKTIPLNLYNVTQAEIAASVVVDPDKPPKTVTIRLTHPNACSLKYDEVGLRLREMLVASGIEPKGSNEVGMAVRAQAAEEEVAEA